MKTILRIITAATVSLLLVSAFGGCSQDRIPAGETPAKSKTHEPHGEDGAEPAGFVSLEEASRLGTMNVQPADLRSLSDLITATGEVQYNPEHLAHLTARLSGWIYDVRAFQEDTVMKGDILAVIDSPDYLTAQTEYLMAFRRSRSGPGTDETQTAQALLASARQKLLLLGAWEEEIKALSRPPAGKAGSGDPQRYLSVRSPLDGTVIESNVVKGNTVRPGDNLYRIADLSTLWVILDIVEQDVARVQQGAPVRITTAAFPDEIYRGSLALLSRTTREATRTVQARVVVENHHRKLRPGMFVQGQIELAGGPKVLAVPESALFLYQGEETVFIQSASGGEKGYQATPIKAGRRQGGWVEILEGLEPNTPVVVDGGFSLKAQLMKESMGEGHGH